jgi:hypothetical protein
MTAQLFPHRPTAAAPKARILPGVKDARFGLSQGSNFGRLRFRFGSNIGLSQGALPPLKNSIAAFAKKKLNAGYGF